jgi:DNA-binding NtrC family response regulator
MNLVPYILLVDDEPEVAKSLARALERRSSNEQYLFAHTRKEALTQIKKESPQVVLLDLTIDTAEGPQSGLSLLNEIVALDPTLRVIVLTSHASSEYGIEALQRGALSYHEKPGDPDLILSLIKDGITITTLKRAHQSLQITAELKNPSLELSTKSPLMAKTIDSLTFAASHNQPVLLYGETGTGKGVFARILHTLRSGKSSPFIRYQPNFSNPDLVASELFGHKRGSFTGANEDRKGLIEEANNGSLFIDEVDALPKEIQVLLLEVTQEKTFRKVGGNQIQKSNFRLISALNKDPKILLKDSILRLDFFHRIAHFQITIPPLRERKEDILLLTENFLQAISTKEDLQVSRIEERALHTLLQYSWPGNIRELQAVIEGGCFRAEYRNSRAIDIEDLSIFKNDGTTNEVAHSFTGSFRNKVRSFEEELVKTALDEHDHNQLQAAKSLQMDRTVFRRILDRIKKD